MTSKYKLKQLKKTWDQIIKCLVKNRTHKTLITNENLFITISKSYVLVHYITNKI